jgi:hypothetical protein
LLTGADRAADVRALAAFFAVTEASSSMQANQLHDE